MKTLYYLIIFFISTSVTLKAQNTVGIILNTSSAFNGYTLFTPKKDTYLINNCGEIVNQWTSSYISGKSVYLLENGNLLRTAQLSNGNIRIPGIGGRIELFDWNGNLIWEYDHSGPTYSLHHDIFPLPNGNILILVATILTKAEAIQLGRDPSLLPENELYNEQILEIQPVGTNSANIIWEWNSIDHLIQDFDNTKSNFGVVSDNPQRINVNYIGYSNKLANWLHINSIQYNADLDQIIMSTRMLSEFYIIDHSTTTAEAASTSGGTYNKGGDILYRWGNPAVYNQGTLSDQKLFGQHFPHWIPNGLPNAGKIILYNNGFSRTPQFSEVFILTPPTSSSGFYTYTNNTAFGPTNPDFIYNKPVKTDFYSPIISSAQQLSNGNILICEGTSGRFFEIDSNKNIVWEYINPVGSTGILSQGDDPQFSSNWVFRATKYGANYAAFSGKTLTSGNPVELNPSLGACSTLDVKESKILDFNIYPNPVSNTLNVQSKENILKIEIYNPLGKLVKANLNSNSLNISNLSSGIYFVKVYSHKAVKVRKIIKQ
jgi:Arylsulfotransferase (ASST)/Secretion system C-terminal sorting domain